MRVRVYTLKNLAYFDKNSQELSKYFVAGLLFSAPRTFWMTMDMTSFPLNHLFLKKALVAAANKEKKTLFLINEQRGEIVSPLDFIQKKVSFISCNPSQAPSYFEQALFDLGFEKGKTFPSLSLVIPQNSERRLFKNLKTTWEKELGIDCQLVSFTEKKSDKTLQLAFAEWEASIKDPLLTLNAFKKATDKLQPIQSNWEHPGYPTLFEKTQKEGNLEKREDYIGRLEEMVMQHLSLLPLFYGKGDI